MRWPWRRNSGDARRARAAAEAQLRAARRQTPQIEQAAEELTLTADEFTELVVEAFARRPS